MNAKNKPLNDKMQNENLTDYKPSLSMCFQPSLVWFAYGFVLSLPFIFPSTTPTALLLEEEAKTKL